MGKPKFLEEEENTNDMKVESNENIGLNNNKPKIESDTKEVKKTEVKKTIEVDADKLQALMDKVEILSKAVDQNKLFQLNNANKKIESIIGLRQIDGKILSRWKLIKNRCEKMPDGKWVEEQIMEIEFMDGTKETINYVDFGRLTEKHKVECVVVAKTQNMEDDVIRDEGLFTYRLKRMDNGEIIERGSNFVN